jgi:hypothetical protein
LPWRQCSTRGAKVKALDVGSFQLEWNKAAALRRRFAHCSPVVETTLTTTQKEPIEER